MINRCAKSALAVYLIHQAPGIIHPLWFDFYHCDKYLTEDFPLIYSAGVIFTCYILSSLIDIFRLKILEPYFVSTSFFKYLSRRLTRFYSCGKGEYLHEG